MGKDNGVRLVITGVDPDVWVQLEPESPEEMRALETCSARGEWTNGRGEGAIARLGALAERLGSPVGPPERRLPPRLVVVQRGERPLYARLTAMARGDAMVVWDRRQRERRTTDWPAAVDRRRQARRQPPPTTWPVLRFLIVRLDDGRTP